MNRLYIALMAVVLASCGKDERLDWLGLISPNGETVDTRFSQSQTYNDSVGVKGMDMGADEYTIYVCSDSHITRKSHRNLDYFVSEYRGASGPKMAIHLGDVIDAQDNYACADSILHFAGQTMDDTIFVTPGNHDIYFKQWSIYRRYFKTSAYWFYTTNGSKRLDLFICLDSAEGALGGLQTRWLRSVLETQSQMGYRHIIVFTHTHLWQLDGSQGMTSNMALEETYGITDMLGQYGVEQVWSGHQHTRQSVLFKGVRYIVTDATKDDEHGPSYMIVSMNETIDHQFCAYP